MVLVLSVPHTTTTSTTRVTTDTLQTSVRSTGTASVASSLLTNGTAENGMWSSLDTHDNFAAADVTIEEQQHATHQADDVVTSDAMEVRHANPVLCSTRRHWIQVSMYPS